jgi:hypothetical protein
MGLKHWKCIGFYPLPIHSRSLEMGAYIEACAFRQLPNGQDANLSVYMREKQCNGASGNPHII